MLKHNPNFEFHIGQRNFKTAFAATLCAFLYYLIDRNPTFACIGAIFGMGNGMKNSKLNGGNRFIGTILGGLIGMLLFSIYVVFYPDGKRHFLMLLFLFVGVITLILCSQYFQWAGAIQPGGVMLCIILLNTPVESYIVYSLNRIIDTGIGVAIALFINSQLSRERLTLWLETAHLRKKEEIPQEAQQKEE